MRIGWLLLVSFFSTFAGAQTYGNEWISYNQKYFSFPVVESGMWITVERELVGRLTHRVLASVILSCGRLLYIITNAAGLLCALE